MTTSRRIHAPQTARMVPFLGAIVLAAVHLADALASAPMPGSDGKAIDSIVRVALAEGKLAGVSVAVLRGNRPILTKGYGRADLENGVPATARTVYRLGSITKQFTAAAILRLAAEGQLTLDDDVTRHVPEYRTQGRRVTIRQLLDHTSGIRSFTEVPAFESRERLDLTPAEMFALFEDEPFDFEPGTNFLYNNSAYYLLGIVIERITGEPYAQYMERHLFQPLGLGDTRSCASAPIVERRAAGYDVVAGHFRNAPYISMNPPMAGGDLCSTVLDLSDWVRALVEGRVVGRASYEQMTTPSHLSDGTPLAYGYGLFLSDVGGHREITHTGAINGFSAVMAHYPADRLTIIVLTNTGDRRQAVESVARAIARRLLGMPADSLRREAPLAPPAFARYVGDYTIGSAEIPVRTAGGNLTIGGTTFLLSDADDFVEIGNPENHCVFSGSGAVAERVRNTRGGRFLGEAVRVVPPAVRR